MKKPTTCFFTGHRKLIVTDELLERLNSTLIRFIENDGITDFYAGGALGWDMVCENAVLNLKQRFPHIKLHLILPCKPDEQCKKWRPEQRAEFDRIFQAADSVEILSEHYYDGCMEARNARLVELGDYCICCLDDRYRSGTRQTVNMANSQGREIFNFL